ncbi:UPF0161 protein [Picochlorum sp. SENEW3]|nr:UPF0161 protein [Picochlorum sp. SENEW3]WPT17349.1 UPF0161 protein [Picochlorum sp. SENEW3]
MAVDIVHKVPSCSSSSSSFFSPSLAPIAPRRRNLRRRECRERSRLVTSSCLECMRLKQQQRRALQPLQSVPPETKGEPSVDEDIPNQEKVGVRIALSMLQFYKTAISPILPPSCRFVPTCSSYAMEAYTEYGVGKGTIMTAWRLLRCTPWGDSGYDPAVWPPRGLGWMTSFLK